jgi:tripartite-type tricarboxylate transporter receptor subunit TctC
MAKLTETFTAAVRTPRFRAVMEAQGATLDLLVGEQMGRAMQAEYTALGEVARSLGLQKQ